MKYLRLSISFCLSVCMIFSAYPIEKVSAETGNSFPCRVLYLSNVLGGSLLQMGVSSSGVTGSLPYQFSYTLNEVMYNARTPYDYWNYWLQNAADARSLATAPLWACMSQYDMLIMKHGIEASYMVSGTSPYAWVRTIDNYKKYYRALRVLFDSFPTKVFMVWTLTPLPLAASSEQQALVRDFSAWVAQEWLYEDGKMHPNIMVFDYYRYVKEGKSLSGTDTGKLFTAALSEALTRNYVRQPVVSSPAAMNITKSSAKITCITDQPSCIKVTYGNSTIGYKTLSGQNTMTSTHTLLLSSLPAQTTFFYSIEAINERGIRAESPHYSFTTLANRAPVVNATLSKVAGNAPLVVSCDASRTFDPDGDSLSYLWDFGDGTYVSGPTVSHTFFHQGNEQRTYSIVLTVSDQESVSNSKTFFVTVAPSLSGNSSSAQLICDTQNVAHAESSFRVPLRLASVWNSMSGCNVEVQFDTQAFSLEGIIPSDSVVKAGGTLVFHKTETGARVMVYSLPHTSLVNGLVCTLQFSKRATVQPKTYTIQLTNPVATSKDGMSLPISSSAGTLTIEPPPVPRSIEPVSDTTTKTISLVEDGPSVRFLYPYLHASVSLKGFFVTGTVQGKKSAVKEIVLTLCKNTEERQVLWQRTLSFATPRMKTVWWVTVPGQLVPKGTSLVLSAYACDVMGNKGEGSETIITGR